MSKRKQFDPTAPPDRWLNCPRKSEELIANTFIAFKTPLSKNFNIPEENIFTIDMLVNSMKSYNAKLGFIIDLTNTNRFYDPETEIKQRFNNAIKYQKIACSGHDGTPSEEQTKIFVELCENFKSRSPTDIIGVHCTHGFNRTGFLICAYLVEKLDFSVEAAIQAFARARRPGIYKQEYIDELFRRYAMPEDAKYIPQIDFKPTWDGTNGDAGNNDSDTDDESDENKSSAPVVKKKRRELYKANPEFAVNINGVQAVTDLSQVAQIQQKVQQICNWDRNGFPGGQPVSMDTRNIQLLRMRNYMVSWKADGTRYLMYIAGKDRVFMLDRDNSVFQVDNLAFPRKDKIDKMDLSNAHLENTLLDGEFVMDVDPETNQKIPRYLIYDIIKFEEINIAKESFKTRSYCIDREIIRARNYAMEIGKVDRAKQPFSVRQKQFYPVNETKRLLSEEFQKQASHGTDGLIFQPVDEPYLPGIWETTLKWKPPSMNSVDFKLKIITYQMPGCLEEEIGELHVGGYEQRFSTIKVTKELRKLDNKIIECKYENNEWKFMRVRTDKSYPNAFKTAMNVCESIRNPVTEEMLKEIIGSIDMNAFKRPPLPPPPPSSSSGQTSTMPPPTSSQHAQLK